MWPDIAAWFQSPGGARVLQTAIVPALSILVAGVLAALIARAALRSALRRADREQAATAVAGLVEAARAAAESEGGRDRRRAARLRTEADVRVRLLPLPGAARAADWAAAATEALAEQRAVADLAVLRDPLVQWVRRPARARRLFAHPAAVTPGPAATVAEDPGTPSVPQDAPIAPEPAAPEPAAEAPTPLPPVAAPERSRFEPPRPPVQPAAVHEEDDAEVPAWRRTRSAERLQQVHDARADADAETEGTAPVTLPHAHRADPAADRATQESDPQELHQAIRRATAVAVDGDEPPARKSPEWLDTYDDDAQVTQNLDLRTPPPVAASAVRDRAPSTDIVPRP